MISHVRAFNFIECRRLAGDRANQRIAKGLFERLPSINKNRTATQKVTGHRFAVV